MRRTTCEQGRKKRRSERYLREAGAHGHAVEAIGAIKIALQEGKGTNNGQQKGREAGVHSQCAEGSPGQNDACGGGDGEGRVRLVAAAGEARGRVKRG